MRRSVLLALAAAALVAAPQAWAEEQHPDKGHEQAPKGGQHPGPQGQHPGGPQGQHPGGPPGQPQGQHPGGPPGQPQGQHPGGPPGQPQGLGPHGWGGQAPHFPQGQPQGQGQHGWGGQPQGRPGGQGQPAGRGQVEPRFDRRANPQQWGQTRGDWRGAHAGWDRNTYWRQNHDWWRGRPEFRGYVGPRLGFWFIPGVGYYQAPREYWGRHWGSGDYLPQVFWQYQVYNWADYGLPPPPWGCAWVWIDGGVALIDLSDGFVLDVEYGLY